jgi:parallel beta-helix repeat protein
MHVRLGICLLAMGLAVGCDDGDDTSGAGGAGGAGPIEPDADGCHHRVGPGDDVQAELQTVLIEAESGHVVCLEAGDYSFTSELSISVDGLTVRGAGADQTRLDFSGQLDGANGIAITGDGVRVEEFAVLNPPGDGVRASGVEGITFRNLVVRWDAEQNSDNGAYGLYPVESSLVLIDNCTVSGASDAGIYVGQSRTIRVQNSEAFGNVAGIEIENSVDAEVVNNNAHDNTGGILVFNLPELPMKEGERVLVHGNTMENNNVPNFGRAGSVVSMVPGGTGAFILASDRNEFRDNIIRNNNSVGMMFISYIDALLGTYDDPAFDKFAQQNWIHDNTYENNGSAPQGVFVDLSIDTGFDLFTDGCLPEMPTDADRNCVSEADDITFMNLGFCGGGRSEDISPHDCMGMALPPQDF